MTSPRNTVHIAELSIEDAVARRARVSTDPIVYERVRMIIERVRREGPEGLRAIAASLGDPEPELLDRAAMQRIASEAPPEVIALFERTAHRVRAVAELQTPAQRTTSITQSGARTTLRTLPVERAACYAPAGRFPLVSSVIMTVVPAKVAGVERTIVVSPSRSPLMIAAALTAGADAYALLGGAQAVAAAAFGVEPMERADVFVGPGNAYVAEAKRQLYGTIGVEGIAGPSEVCVVSDADSNPELVAADLLAQAEHDPQAEAILLLPTGVDAQPILDAITHQLETLDTAQVAAESLRARGAIIRFTREADLPALIDRLAPEHLALHLPIERARELAAHVRHAGAIFIGEAAAEALGDYGAGPNHTLPTGATARFQQGLSPMAFLRQRAELEVTEPDEALLSDVAAMAALEGLPAHRLAANLRSPS
ncbi:MAG: histidinol dehydrogenase [Phycisphaeraceae bacterium]|nr:MAG: histidinol dehydrogenase [Phycisphaeraceae bacterium]